MSTESWSVRALGDVSHVEMGQSPPSEFVSDQPGNGMAFLQGNAEFTNAFPRPRLWCTRPAKVAKPGDILISVRAPVGAINRADREYCIGRGLAAVRFTGVDPDFGYHALARFSAALHRVAQGTTFDAIGGPELRGLTLPHYPRPEQRRIAEILDTVDDAILNSEQLIAKLQQMKQGLLRDLLTRGIDEKDELRDPQQHPEQFADSAIGRIPTTWDVTRLVDVIVLPSGQLDPKIEPYRSWPLIAPDHIEAGTGRLLANETAASQGAISGKYSFRAGDILYSKIRPYLRKATLADWEGLCSADMYPLRPGPRIRSRFLLAVILGEDFSRFAESVSMRSGFPKINREELGEYSLGLPDLTEQDRLGQVLSAFDDRMTYEDSLLSKLRLLKAGLMDDLLTGRTRVTKLLEGSAA